MLTILFPLRNGGEAHAGGNQGDGLQNPTVNLIFAGDWTHYATSEAAIISAVDSIVTGPYLSGLRQYGTSGTATIGTVGANTTQFIPTLVSGQPNDAELNAYVQQSIDAGNGVPVPGPGDQVHAPFYVVVLNPADWALSNAGTDYSGFNTPGQYSTPASPFGNVPINMALISTNADSSNNIAIDSFTTTFSHELAERSMNNTQVFTLSAAEVAASNGFYHAGDVVQVCDGEMDNSTGPYVYRLNGYDVQAYWSDMDQTAIVPNVPYYSSTASFTLSPVWAATPTPHFEHSFDLSIDSGLQPVTFTSVAGGGIAAAYNGQTATFRSGDDPLNSISDAGTVKLTLDDSNNSQASNFSVGNGAQSGWGYVQGLYPGTITFPYQYTAVVELDASNTANNNVVNVYETGSQTNVVCDGSGSAAINIGNTLDGVQDIQGPVSILTNQQIFGTPLVSVKIDDTADLSPRTVNVENLAGTLVRGRVDGLAPVDIDYDYAIASLTILTSAENGNLVNVLETACRSDIIGQIQSTSTVRVGDSNGIANILAKLFINGPAELLGPAQNTTIIINDSNDQSARTIALFDSSNGVDGVVGMSPADIFYQYWNTASLTIDLSLVNGNVVNVLQSGTTTNINSFSAYTATVNIDDAIHSPSGLRSDLNIGNSLVQGAPTISLNVDGQLDSVARVINIGNQANKAGWGSISGVGKAHINYQYAATSNLTVSTDKSFGNYVNVLEDGATTHLIIDAVTFVTLGDASTGARSIVGNLFLESDESGTPDLDNLYITINDSADPTVRTATVTTFTPIEHRGNLFFPDSPWGSLSGVAPATINYEYADTNRVLIQGNTADQIVNPGSTPVFLNDAPVVTSISPASAPLSGGGETITIHGDDLGNANGVRFGNGTFERSPRSLFSIPFLSFGRLRPKSPVRR